ncbi:glycosyltransferase [Roseateles sp. DAIF2]|uniref:glycosyltransferase family 2 protein n=1 Tax=Roseateles sp. DAIF2 TaxID=2714952 RepID=UPI0018A30FE1|nr:glycosyltransferase [Roseateles sp. DAIF2]QPF73770.1 glycosyltransferase [Roseateles sp. DAIF2]
MQITTLIPAYKTKYMAELLTGLRTQSRLCDRIIVSDDSPNGEFGELLASPAMARLRGRLPIELVRGPRAGAYENFKHLIRLWGGSTELGHLLLDDDILYPDFFDRHLEAHARGRFGASISARWNANEQGQPIEGMPIPPGVWRAEQRMLALDASAMFASTVPLCQNWFGEFSNCLFRREHAELLFTHEFAGVSYAGLWDLGFFLDVSLREPVAYLQERLGAFRTGGEGHSAQFFGKHMKAAHLGYAALARGAHKLGRLDEAAARQCYQGIALALQQRYAEQPDMVPFAGLLARLAGGDAEAGPLFEAAWGDFLRLHQF